MVIHDRSVLIPAYLMPVGSAILRREYLFVPAQAIVAEFLETFKEFPPRMKAPSFSIDQILAKLQTPASR